VRRFFIAAVCFCLIVSTAQADTYLVLPFFNVSKNPSLDWIGESLAEALREALASEGLIALNRDDRVEAYRRLAIRPRSLLTRASVVKIGEALDAEQVIFGQFDLQPVPESGAKTKGSLQVTARLLDLKHVRQGPEFREVSALEDLASLQSRLAWQTVRFLKPNGAPSEAEFQNRHPVVKVNAIENYVRGLLALNPDEEHRFFTQAARLDPHYSAPCFQLGRLLWRKKEYKSAAEWFQKVSPEDVHYHEAAFFLGLSRYYAGDFAGAQTAYQSVLRIVPLSEVYNNLGAAESRTDSPGALGNFQKALEGDTRDPAYQFNVGYALWKKGDYQAATAVFASLIEHNPEDEQASMLLARCVKRSGPRPGDTQTEGLERLKTNYEESAYLQLKALLQPEKE
jgi:tetratricopeptide (TPR) repeat protein